MIPKIIDDLKVKDNSISGRYSVKCPTCGYDLVVFVELTSEGHFCYTAKIRDHSDCHLLDSDFTNIYSCNPFPMRIAKIYYSSMTDEKINWTEESQKDNIPNNLCLYSQDGWEYCLMSIIEDGDHGHLVISDEFAKAIHNALYNLPAKCRQKQEGED